MGRMKEIWVEKQEQGDEHQDHLNDAIIFIEAANSSLIKVIDEYLLISPPTAKAVKDVVDTLGIHLSFLKEMSEIVKESQKECSDSIEALQGG